MWACSQDSHPYGMQFLISIAEEYLTCSAFSACPRMFSPLPTMAELLIHYLGIKEHYNIIFFIISWKDQTPNTFERTLAAWASGGRSIGCLKLLLLGRCNPESRSLPDVLTATWCLCVFRPKTSTFSKWALSYKQCIYCDQIVSNYFKFALAVTSQRLLPLTDNKLSCLSFGGHYDQHQILLVLCFYFLCNFTFSSSSAISKDSTHIPWPDFTQSHLLSNHLIGNSNSSMLEMWGCVHSPVGPRRTPKDNLNLC